MGLPHLVFISPAFDPPDDYFLRAGTRNRCGIRPLHKIAGDKALLFKVFPSGTDKDAHQRLENAIRDISALANIWEDPQAAYSVLHQPEP